MARDGRNTRGYESVGISSTGDVGWWTNAADQAEREARNLSQMALNAPKYEIPSELQDAIASSQETYGGLTSEAEKRYKEAQDRIAAARQENMPGYQMYADRIGSSSARAVSEAQRYGGYGALGELSEIQSGELRALGELNTQNVSYQREREALREAQAQQAFSQYAGISSQAASAGLQGASMLADQQATQFQYNQLMPWQTQMNIAQEVAKKKTEQADQGAIERLWKSIF